MPNAPNPLIQVALPVPLNRVFDYLVPHKVTDTVADNLLANNSLLPPIGSRVSVPFGRQTLIGIVVAHISHSELSPTQLKPIYAVLDNEPILDTAMLTLANWLARYYHYPLGDVLAVMLPTLVRQGKPLDISQCYWRPLRPITPDDFGKNAHKQKQQMTQFSQIYSNFFGEIAATQGEDCLYKKQGIAEDILLLQRIERPFLQKFAEKGLIERFLATPPAPKPVTLAHPPLTLNLEQQLAVTAINFATVKTATDLSPSFVQPSPTLPTVIADSLQEDPHNYQHYQGFLLNGVTGSGKTEVYLQAMQPVLAAGKQVLILVPEIGLTPQTRQRFAERFAAAVLMLHSGLNDSIRLQGWQSCRHGVAQIIIGTRSAVLYPFADLGLIIVDESHDGSYKQHDTLRYHAADVALYRGYQTGCPVVLGTATPSLESLQLVKQGKLTELTLTQRAGNAVTAPIRLIDARQQKWQHGLTQALIHEMTSTLARQEQVLVFINRRGYAPILLCDACGWQADCPRCDAHLTVHYHPISLLKCHHCDWQHHIPTHCPECNSGNLDAVGMGTSRMVEGLGVLFPDTPIIQIDRDTTRRKDSWEKVYEQIAQNPAAILVGTQMVAKGHHFPNVTLVAMPSADRGFLSADFRSPEHTAQLIVQVAGRAGRAEKTGQVLIQTLQPENPALLTLVRQGYLPFAEQLLAERKLLGLPPITHACLIRVESKTFANNERLLNDAKALLPSRSELTQLGLAVHGPIDAPMAKKNNRFHSHLLIMGKTRPALHGLLDGWWERVLALPSAKYLRVTLDIDPSGWG